MWQRATCLSKIWVVPSPRTIAQILCRRPTGRYAIFDQTETVLAASLFVLLDSLASTQGMPGES